jgi:hypothetical protein
MRDVQKRQGDKGMRGKDEAGGTKNKSGKVLSETYRVFLIHDNNFLVVRPLHGHVEGMQEDFYVGVDALHLLPDIRGG